ncbi:MAG TPA: GNAT family N-acetyltransferase [Candidatus Dormibacteraeota bacterium]|nr:GNAT family N-acetyltransferase [Candidatus Dormibacteraeota bacterium]
MRAASFRDLARVEQLYRDALAADESGPGPHPDSPVPQATLLRLWYALSKTLSSLVPLSDTGGVLFVAEDGGEGVVGFIQAQATSTRPSVWQIVNLCVAPGGAGHFARERLLTHLCNRGLEQGVHRFHVRLPLDHPLVGVFLEHGFTQFATEQILFHETPELIERSDARPLAVRPGRREDAAAIHLLYRRVTPSQIAAFEAPSLKAWQASFAQGSVARIGRDENRHLVAEHPGVVGWAAIRPAGAGRPSILSLMCEAHDPAIREGFLDAVLAELPPQPVSCVLRHYDSELIRSLQHRGFAVYGTQLLLVRDLGIKVRIRAAAKQSKQVLAHAGVASSHVSAPSLTVLHPPERRER